MESEHDYSCPLHRPAKADVRALSRRHLSREASFKGCHPICWRFPPVLLVLVCQQLSLFSVFSLHSDGCDCDGVTKGSEHFVSRSFFLLRSPSWRSELVPLTGATFEDMYSCFEGLWTLFKEKYPTSQKDQVKESPTNVTAV